MDAARIQARAVIKVVAIVDLSRSASPLLLNYVVIVEIKTTIRWLCAAIFLALALNPARRPASSASACAAATLPRWLAILVVYVLFFAVFMFLVLAGDPADHPARSSSSAPRSRATSPDFRAVGQREPPVPQLNHKYDITGTLQSQASSIPSKLGDAAGDVQEVTVGVLEQPDRRGHDPRARRSSCSWTGASRASGCSRASTTTPPCACGGSPPGSPGSSSPTSR